MPFLFTMPKLSPTMEEGTIAKWHKKPGDFVEAGELILEIATDKATLEHSALDAGWLKKILVEEGTQVLVNDPIAIFTEEETESIEGFEVPKKKAPKKSLKKEKESEAVEKKEKVSFERHQPEFIPPPPLEDYAFPTRSSGSRIKASPLAKKIAEEKGLDLHTVEGSGPGGRIMERDLERAQKSSKLSFSAGAKPSIPPGSYEEEALSPMRRVISQRLQDAKAYMPHFYVTVTVDAEPLINVREELSSLGIKISINDCIVRASALALREHPEINSGYHSKHETIVRFKTIDIAVAVSLKEGLITPIIRHADYKNVKEISQEVRLLVKRAKEGKLLPEEYQGGSFTVSNLGMYGVTEFQAIINPPQAAILAVSGVLDVPVVKKGMVVPGKTMRLSLSSDHRVIDGVAAAKFLSTLKNYLQKPSSLII